jgi:hypothetical protein
MVTVLEKSLLFKARREMGGGEGSDSISAKNDLNPSRGYSIWYGLKYRIDLENQMPCRAFHCKSVHQPTPNFSSFSSASPTEQTRSTSNHALQTVAKVSFLCRDLEVAIDDGHGQ